MTGRKRNSLVKLRIRKNLRGKERRFTLIFAIDLERIRGLERIRKKERKKERKKKKEKKKKKKKKKKGGKKKEVLNVAKMENSTQGSEVSPPSPT